jgi:hypothetical protein
MLSGMPLSILIALLIALMIIATTVFVVFYHDRKHEELDQWVDFAFSRDGLRHALGYYRFLALAMLTTYVLFTCSLLLLQADGHMIFADAGVPTRGGPIATALFTLDLVLRGGFFDFMQHFDLAATHLTMNRQMHWFVWYAFVFRMFYGLTMFKILFSFVWIYGKTRIAHQAQRSGGGLPFLR